MNKMGGGRVRVSRLFIKTFCSTALKTFVREPFSLLLISGFETNVLRGLCHVFLSKFCSLVVPKSFLGERFYAVFQKNSVRQILLDMLGKAFV